MKQIIKQVKTNRAAEAARHFGIAGARLAPIPGRLRAGNFLGGIVLAGLLLAALPAGADGLAVGSRAPDFTFTGPDGGTHSLSDYRGKPLVLHFWATWCGPCVGELPLISRLETQSRNMTTLAVNCAETDREVSSFLRNRKLTLNVVMDRTGQISELYNIYAIPQTFMIDGEGVIRSIRVGAYNQRELNRDVSALLGR
ncbi:MAG: TlpA family protein disulfide reductase [Treponema sp.]|jgi:thiol-disulfide isomerase/thioredoxin|nr:TlpA family protein disulfide reductase [Treponema sp.]